MFFMKIFLSLFLRITQMTLGKETLSVEVADTPEAKAQGLMGRTALSESQGMLFVYEAPSRLTFWMKNTHIPLSIGFFNENQELIHIEHMNPPKQNTSLILYRSPPNTQYALEVSQGWFSRHEIQLGTKFSLHDDN